MLRNRVQPWIDWLRRVITQPRGELTRWQRAARFAYDLGRYGAKQLREDRAPQMAAALAFRTLFGLVPVLVVATVLARSWMGAADFQNVVTEAISWLNLYDVVPGVAGMGGGADEVMSFGQWMESLIQQAPQINLAAIGWIGMAVLVYSAIGLMVTIENSFNTVCRAPEGRTWSRRVPLYWFVLTFCPVVIGLTIYIDTRFDLLVTSMGAGSWLLSIAGAIWGFILTWLFMFAIYALVPNIAIDRRAAMGGAFVAAVLVEIGRRSLDAYLGHALSIQQLYGSLGLIPLFMFWVYLMWLVVLFGLEVASTLHALAGRRVQSLEHQKPRTGLVDPGMVLVVMETLGERFAGARPTTPEALADEVGLPVTTVRQMVERLLREGLIHRVAHPEGAIVLACPPESIAADRLLKIGFQIAEDSATRPQPVLDRLRDAQRNLLQEVTLASILTKEGIASSRD